MLLSVVQVAMIFRRDVLKRFLLAIVSPVAPAQPEPWKLFSIERLLEDFVKANRYRSPNLLSFLNSCLRPPNLLRVKD